MYKDEFLPLKMNETLEGNCLVDESTTFEKLSITEEECTVPIIHVYYNDDLTIA